MKNRILTSGVTLLLLLSSVLLSCQDSDTNSAVTNAKDKTADTQTESTAEPGEASGVPAGTDLGGEVLHLWYTTGWPSYTDIAGEQSGDVLDDAVYMQNLNVQERLNCTISFEDPGVAQGVCNEAISKLLLANDTAYDIFCPTQWSGAKLIAQGLYLNIADMPYLSYDAPWWDLAYMKEGSVGTDRIYMLVGDCTIDRMRYLSCVYYNKQMYQNYFDDADGLYNTVLDGKWTYETLQKLSETVYSDLNGNNKADEDDRIGVRLCWNQDIMALQFCTDVSLTTRDADQIPHISANSEKMVEVVNKLYTLAFETQGIVYGNESETKENEIAVRQFLGDNSLFYFGQLQSSEYLRDMKTDYGVIPTPKLDEAQKEYHSYMFEVMRFMALPYNCQKTEAACALLEEMAFEGYQKVTPVYYETVLKNKYIRDDVSGKMIDLVRDGMKTDIALIHIIRWDSVSLLVRDTVLKSKKSHDFASAYEKKRKSIEKDEAEFLEAMNDNT